MNHISLKARLKRKISWRLEMFVCRFSVNQVTVLSATVEGNWISFGFLEDISLLIQKASSVIGI